MAASARRRPSWRWRRAIYQTIFRADGRRRPLAGGGGHASLPLEAKIVMKIAASIIVIEAYVICHALIVMCIMGVYDNFSLVKFFLRQYI